MVLLSNMTMHPARSRTSGPEGPSYYSFSTSDVSAVRPQGNSNGLFYLPSRSEDTPAFSKGYSQSHNRSRRNSGPALGMAGMGSPVTSPVTSPGTYSSLTNLDVWSPNSVSISSLLRHSSSGDMHGKMKRNSIHNGFVHVNGVSSRLSGSDGTSGISSLPNYSHGPVPDHEAASHVPSRHPMGPKSRMLRRTMSADPRNRDRDPYYSSGRPLGSKPDPDVGGMPRVCSDGDLLETEQLALEETYPAPETERESRIDTVQRKYSDIPASPSSVHLTASSSFSDFGRYRRFYSEEGNYYHSSDYSSGYSSNGSSSGRSTGSTGSLQRSDTLPASRSVSAERPWAHHPRATSPLERGRCALPRKKSSQTLQTVAENIVQGLAAAPTKSILKNGNNNNNSNNNAGGGSISGRTTPGSTSSSRRGSLTSRQGLNGTLDSSYTTNSDVPITGLESCRDTEESVPKPNAGNARVKPNSSLSSTIGSTGSKDRGAASRPKFRHRSKSLSDLRLDPAPTRPQEVSGYSDDEDGDHFGFLSRPGAATGSVSACSTAMQKGKAAGTTTSPSQRLLPRRWRSKNKTASSAGGASHPAQAMWSSEGPCTWCSVSGRKVILKPVSILQLSEAERLALQKLASSKLQAMDLSCPIVIPKDATDLRRQKKRALSLKRKSKSANLTSLLDTLSSDKDIKPAGLVFGIPLSRVIANDRELAKRGGRTPVVAPLKTRCGSADHLLSPRQGRKSSSSSQGSLDNGQTQNGTVGTTNPDAIYDSARRAASSDSLSETDSRNTSSNLIEALSLHAMTEQTTESESTSPTPQVPHVVDACFKHLEIHGLNVVGIFRVGSSKKRVKQLREEFDSGKDVQLTDEHSVHDVGALLKEFFRDLPEPLLTRDLYLPLVATRKLKDREERAEAVRLLLTLLPASNRDTLWALLRFLATVHRHSQDTIDDSGQVVQGNKMDSNNLATIFGPNVLHRARAVSEKQFMAECVEQAEQSAEVIGVIKDMIDHHYDLFEISASQRDEVLKLMMEADQENLDHVLRRLSNENQIEPDPESSGSVFEADSELQQNLPHSTNSDADLLSLVRKKGVVHHRPLRVTRSADHWLEDDPHSAESPGEKKRPCSVDSTPGDRLSHSPSPQDRAPAMARRDTGTLPRAAAVSVPQDSGEVTSRPGTARRRRRGQDTTSSVTARPLSTQTGVRERPSSDTARTLGLPPQPYTRDNSSYQSASSEGPTFSPQRRSAIQGTATLPGSGRRRRPILKSSSRSDDDDGSVAAAVGSAEWQRERWRHWEQIAASKKGGAGEVEQETLV